MSCRFHIAQHIRDIELMNLFSKFFNCGTVYVRSNSSERCDFVVQDIKKLLSNIIPHFDLYPILNLKYQDYICFKKTLFINIKRIPLGQGKVNYFSKIYKERFLITKEQGSNK